VETVRSSPTRWVGRIDGHLFKRSLDSSLSDSELSVFGFKPAGEEKKCLSEDVAEELCDELEEEEAELEEEGDISESESELEEEGDSEEPVLEKRCRFVDDEAGA